MIETLIARAREAGASRVFVVVGHGLDKVKKAVPKDVTLIHQEERLGSGHAVHVAEKALSSATGSLLVLYCDTPLLKKETLRALVRNHREARTDATLLSAELSDPTGYGRVILKRGRFVERIVEHNDTTDDEKKVREVNVGCYVFDKKKLFTALGQVKKNPKKKEYYLTDAVGILAANGTVEALRAVDVEETYGVNDRVELARAEDILRRRILEGWMKNGVGIRDPKTTSIDSDVRLGQDTVVLPHTVIEEGSVIGERCVIGPFARIRGGSQIGNRVVVGNFVEIVRSRVGVGTQIKHLSYIGDAQIGEKVNIGAGTITANYDGKKKHQTVIRDRAQIGSGTIFVAPVTVGRAAKTGAGSVVTKGTKIPDQGVYAGVPARELKRKKEERKGKNKR
jgi:bifunctional UDP-N-acetylglucosamine pyrophosphorylase/glucosamine-1-phosphate N-acetyltransferase